MKTVNEVVNPILKAVHRQATQDDLTFAHVERMMRVAVRDAFASIAEELESSITETEDYDLLHARISMLIKSLREDNE
mgnify:CR=1 FL=1